VSIDAAATRSTQGTVFIEGNRVTVQAGSIAPDAVAVVEIPVTVAGDVGASVANQASVQYAGAAAPVQSNSFVAQVAAPAAAPAESQPEAPVQAPAQTQPQAPAQTQPQAPAQTQPQAPAQAQPAAPAQAPAQTQPQAPVQAPAQTQPQAPAKQPVAAPPASTSGSAQQAPPAAKQNAPIPRTGGGFPVWLAVMVLLLTLFARYLRGRTYRRV
jgi:cobalamin biosynthesis Mg chelatase CobN